MEFQSKQTIFMHFESSDLFWYSKFSIEKKTQIEKYDSEQLWMT